MEINKPNNDMVLSGNVECRQCDKTAVPAYTSKDYCNNPEGLVPHVLYGTCTECNHDQSGESF